MSLGLTPQDFVKQVFYLQEKVLLDFHPTDDVYKEVLTEANMVLEELQKDEDWLWLRKTVPLGFIDQNRGFVRTADCWHHHHPFHAHHRQLDPTTLKIPNSVYKPSELYGDCIRLCRYHWRKDFIDMFPMMNDHFFFWNDKFDEGFKYTDFDSVVLHGEVPIECLDSAGISYNATYLCDFSEVDFEYMLMLLPANTWSLDMNNDVYVCLGDIPKMVVKIHAVNDVPHIEPEYHCTHCKSHIHDHHHCSLPWVFPHWFKGPHPIYEQPLGFQRTMDFIVIDEFDSIKIPYVSAGMMYRRNIDQTNRVLMNNMPERTFGCIVQGDTLKFDRPLRWYEHDRVVLMDAQMRIEPFHICDDSCVSFQELHSGERYECSYPLNPCCKVIEQTKQRMLTEIPDPMYVVAKTAAMHAEGSPPAQAMLQTLNDRAQKLLSSMRSANAEFTEPDMADWAPMEYINII